MLARRDQRTVQLRRRGAAVVGAMGSRTASYATAEPVAMSLQPGGGMLHRELYGERAANMLTAYCGRELAVVAGDGVCVDVAGSAAPDYIVVGVRNWPGHAELDLERK